MVRRLRSLVVIVASIAAIEQAGLKTRLYAQAQAPAAIQSSDLAGTAVGRVRAQAGRPRAFSTHTGRVCAAATASSPCPIPPAQILGNAMHPANWDSPIALSPFDPATIYAGAKHLFRSRDRGTTWEDLGEMTTGVDRATLPLMGRKADETVLSIDDGVPYYPGLVSIALSPLTKGLLVIHPRDNDLVLGTHGCGIWILDKINALQELTPQGMASSAHLFTVAPAYQIRQTSVGMTMPRRRRGCRARS